MYSCYVPYGSDGFKKSVNLHFYFFLFFEGFNFFSNDQFFLLNTEPDTGHINIIIAADDFFHQDFDELNLMSFIWTKIAFIAFTKNLMDNRQICVARVVSSYNLCAC